MNAHVLRKARNLGAGVVLGALIAVYLGRMSVGAPSLALAAATVPAVIALAVANTGLLAAAVLPAVYLTFRVGPSSLDMSIADLSLILGIVVAVSGITRFGRTLSGLLQVVLAYEVLMIVIVAAHPSALAITEWVHRAGLMAGGMLVGATIVRYDKLTIAVRAFVATTVVFALGAAYQSVTSGFAPAYPLGIHKNAAGGLFAMAIAFLATAPASSGVPLRYRRELYLLMGIGLFATRSRGAILGLGMVLFVLAFTRNTTRALRFLAVITAIGGLWFVWTSVQNELRTDVTKTGAIGVRERQQKQAWAAFETNTVRGAGIRYYNVQKTLAKDGRPSSTIYEALAESGYIGTAGLAIVVFGPLRILRRSRSPWRSVALSVFAVKALHGVVDNFWVAGPFTLPWVIIGIAAALEVRHEADANEPSEPESEPRRPALTAAS